MNVKIINLIDGKLNINKFLNDLILINAKLNINKFF